MLKRFSLLLIILSLLLVSCVESPKPSIETGSVIEKPVWPAPPAPARIAWQGEIKDFRDFRKQESFWQRLVGLIVGQRQSGLVKPYGIYVDDHGHIFVVDTGARRVYLLDTRDGSYKTIPSDDENPFLSPIDITGDGVDTIFISDSKKAKLFIYSISDGRLLEFPTIGLQRPTGITCCPQKKLLYVADTLAHQIVALEFDGRERFRFGERGVGPGQFNFPTAVTLNESGMLVVTDALNGRIQIFSADGNFELEVGRPGDTSGTFAKPKGIALDSDNNIYVCDALFDAVQVFDQGGRLLLTFGDSGSRPGQFWMPTGIFIDGKDNVYVADSYNQRIQIFRYLK
ncbi:MAG: 6-bladed beta-propeller [Deltaproteobacteria bacterium]|nr:MAG: 6-bladed beta-propeller [Deltaproteobacteria bacterium]